MDWPESVKNAIIRSAQKYGTSVVTRRALVTDELDRIVRETESEGKTPDQTLSRILQDLRDEGFIEFVGRGEYKITHVKPQIIVSADIGEITAAERKEVTTTRVVRDTDLVSKLKTLYENKCQICSYSIDLGSRYYSEGHHIQPLGTPHHGPDNINNIIIVCPNHHVLLDFGAIKLELSKLKLLKHKIDPYFLNYHNKQIVNSVGSIR